MLPWTALDFTVSSSTYDNTPAEKLPVCLATTTLTTSRDDLCEKSGLARIRVGAGERRNAWKRIDYVSTEAFEKQIEPRLETKQYTDVSPSRRQR